MNQYAINKINQAIAECDRYIDLESKRDPSLRPVETQKLLDFYIAHRVHLISMLVN